MSSDETAGFIYDVPLVGDFQGTEVSIFFSLLFQVMTLFCFWWQILYQDGSRAFLVQDEDGNLFIPTEEQLLVNDVIKQEQIAEGLVGEEEQQIVYYADGTCEENGVQLVQYVDENGDEWLEEQQQQQQEFLDSLQLENEGNVDSSESVCYKYAVIKDGRLVLQDIPEVDFLNCLKENSVKQVGDVSKITGRNLITGQTITLNNYIDKINGKKNETVEAKDRNSLVAKKTNDKTPKNKKLVGKIVRIEKKGETKDAQPSPAATKSFVLKKCVMTKDTYDYVTRMMVGLMLMESVSKRLEGKNLKVRVVEKSHTDESQGIDKVISRLYGYMARTQDASSWKFVPLKELDEQQVKSAVVEGLTDSDFGESPYKCSTSLTLIINTDKSGKRTMRVNLTPSFKKYTTCTICSQKFYSSARLSKHIEEKHPTSHFSLTCDVCEKGGFKDAAALEKHKKSHEYHVCEVCGKIFSSEATLRRHIAVHSEGTEGSASVYQCGLCNASFSDAEELNGHLKAHEIVRSFMCGICGRQFSRHSNLLRHLAIHTGEGASYQ